MDFADRQKYEDAVQKIMAGGAKEKFADADIAFAKGCEEAGLPSIIAALALVSIHEQVAKRLMDTVIGKGIILACEAEDEEE